MNQLITRASYIAKSVDGSATAEPLPCCQLGVVARMRFTMKNDAVPMFPQLPTTKGMEHPKVFLQDMIRDQLMEKPTKLYELVSETV